MRERQCARRRFAARQDKKRAFTLQSQRLLFLRRQGRVVADGVENRAMRLCAIGLFGGGFLVCEDVIDVAADALAEVYHVEDARWGQLLAEGGGEERGEMLQEGEVPGEIDAEEEGSGIYAPGVCFFGVEEDVGWEGEGVFVYDAGLNTLLRVLCIFHWNTK